MRVRQDIGWRNLLSKVIRVQRLLWKCACVFPWRFISLSLHFADHVGLTASVPQILSEVGFWWEVALTHNCQTLSFIALQAWLSQKDKLYLTDVWSSRRNSGSILWQAHACLLLFFTITLTYTFWCLCKNQFDFFLFFFCVSCICPVTCQQ